MRPRVVELILRKCLGHRPGEAALVVTDTVLEPLARTFVQGARDLGIETSLVSMAPRTHHGAEPPASVAGALKTCPMAVLLTSKSLTHTMALREARERHGVRAASMPGVDATRLEALLDIDYDALRARNDEIASFLQAGRRLRLTSAAGTDLTFEIAGRTLFRDGGDLAKPGAFGNLPAGEVCVAPVEGTAEGVVVIDASIGGLGRLKTPVTVRIAQGRAVEIGDERLRQLLEPHGPQAMGLSEFGIGTNLRAAIVGNVLEDEKAAGTVHVAFGANHALGGCIQAPVRVGAMLTGARVEVDGKPIPEVFLAPSSSIPAPDLSVIDLSAADTFRTLFENSNDPQVVLDLETQRFLAANPSFERLSGYTRDEMLSGAVTFNQLVARESFPTYMQKRETRRSTPAERYDMRLLTRAGEKKPVELSVRLVPLSGRETVLVSIRDLSQRKQLEQEMWAKIEDLGRANSRVFALTEKIRRVPELTPQLLHINDEEELLERAGRILCARDGLAYGDVTFYLIRGAELELTHSTIKTKKRKIRLPPDDRLSKILRGEEPASMTSRDAVLPLKGRDENIGILEVVFDPKELEILQDNERAMKGYRDLLETLCSVLGLLVENLRLYEQVRRQAIVDHLTGVYNRRYFDSKLAEEAGRASRYGRDLSLVLIDVDHFKEINDRMSYKQGDLVLAEAARLFRAHTREVDTVCRYGGDEFAILMPETKYENALVKAENLRETVRTTPFANVLDVSRPLTVTLSIGVTGHHAELKGADEFLRAADEAVHHAKRSGRDQVWGLSKGVRTSARG